MQQQQRLSRRPRTVMIISYTHPIREPRSGMQYNFVQCSNWRNIASRKSHADRRSHRGAKNKRKLDLEYLFILGEQILITCRVRVASGRWFERKWSRADLFCVERRAEPLGLWPPSSFLILPVCACLTMSVSSCVCVIYSWARLPDKSTFNDVLVLLLHLCTR